MQRRAEAIVDLGAIRANTAALAAHAGTAALMAVVKADGYGHGMLPTARAALAGGARWLGTATLDEALALRAADDLRATPVLAWLWTPDETAAVGRAVTAGIELGVSNAWQLATVAAAGRELDRPARVHLKIDTGLSRNGCAPEDWPDLVAAAAKTETAGELEVTGVWSHLAAADEPGHPSVERQLARFDDALAVAARAGLEPRWRHLANSAGLLTRPDAHFDLVRAGIAVYGLDPLGPGAGPVPLVPALTLRAAAASVKRVPAGEGVSYGLTYVAPRATTLVDVPLGYADGVPRHASGRGPVAIGGHRFTVAGRVCMDQFVVDVGDLDVAPGDPVTLFGPGTGGEPTAQDWADAAGTIHYEIVTRLGARVSRTYLP